jgi:hypothetical protein
VGVALIIEVCEHKLLNYSFCKGNIHNLIERRKSDTCENWKNAHTKGYVLSLIIGPPLLKDWGGGASGPPGSPGSYSTED